MLTALGEDVNRIVGLEIGADDYVTKPFNSRELVARIRALLRRSYDTTLSRSRSRAFRFAGWLIDPSSRQLRNPEDEIGRAHVLTPVTNAQLVCRLLLEQKTHLKDKTLKRITCIID